MKILYIEAQKLLKNKWGLVEIISMYTMCRTNESIIKDALKKFKAYAVSGTYNISIHINDTATKEGIIQTENVCLIGTGFAKTIDL